MKKTIIVLAWVSVVLLIIGCKKRPHPEEYAYGYDARSFTTDDNTRVCFSQGNLQYEISAGIWRFAEHQYDYVGAANCNIGVQNYNGWIDLFGYGTGNNPTKYYGDFNHFYDWGNNEISNGDNKNWRTLKAEEWNYIFITRKTRSGIRYAMASVNGINGVVLLPDRWLSSIYYLNNTNNEWASYRSNTISLSNWTDILEANGAVFLPAAGDRDSLDVYSNNDIGVYWSNNDGCEWNGYYYTTSCLCFKNGHNYVQGKRPCSCGCSVRLVYDVE